MSFEKKLLGVQQMEDLHIAYYMIRKNQYYGIAIEEDNNTSIQCQYEYFTESQEEAYQMGDKMHRGIVTRITMASILDDYLN